MEPETNQKKEESRDEIDIDLDAELKEAKPNTSLSGKTVLIVDDDNFLLEMYARKFKNSGFEIITSSGGEDAINKLTEGANPDILLFDLVMPQMDGLELIANIKKENLIPTATKIVLSNQGQQTDMDKANEIGVDGYIVKALHTPSEIVEMVIKLHQDKNK
jgi:CheY-like chemotaxis protein